jgi:hypothetical protein
MVWLLVAASPAKCASFINPPVLHDSLKISYYDPTYGWSSYAARGSAFWKNVVYISGWPSNNTDDPPRRECTDPIDREDVALDTTVPSESNQPITTI